MWNKRARAYCGLGGAACPIRRSPIQKLQMGLFLPFVSVALLILTFCFHYGFIKLRARRDAGNRLRVGSNESDLKITDPLEDTDEEAERSALQKLKDAYLRTMCGLFLWRYGMAARVESSASVCACVIVQGGDNNCASDEIQMY